MEEIKITKGLNIPIKGEPTGSPQPFVLEKSSSVMSHPTCVALDLTAFEELKFKMLAHVDERVKLGQPLLEDKDAPGRVFVSPAGGVIREIRRGLKRRLLYIVIEVDQQEEIEKHPPIALTQLSRQELIERLQAGGLFTLIRQRPFNLLAHPQQTPRSIFVKALESAPLTPPAEWQVTGYEKEFQVGLDALARLTDGPVHLVYRKGTTSQAFLDAQRVQKHAAEGPHPIANVSVHIEKLHPICSMEDLVWTLDARAVVAIGYFILHGQPFVTRVISIAGPGIMEGKTGFFKVREGIPISALLDSRLKKESMRLLSGNPLTGHQVEPDDFLGYYDTVFCAIPENTQREFLSFFRLGMNKYTFSGTYLSGHLNHAHRTYDFTTNQHGEHRPFIDSSLYDKVMPLNIPTMQLVRAILAEDYDLAVQLGLLEVDSEDFALPSFICPSKMEMVEIVKKGLHRYALEVLK